MDLSYTFRQKFNFIQINPLDINKLNEDNIDASVIEDIPDEPATPPPQKPPKPKKPEEEGNLEDLKIKTQREEFTKWLDAEYFSSVTIQDFEPVKSDNDIDLSLLDDKLYIHTWLEPYREMLYYYGCPSDLHETIMKNLESELRDYYTQNGEKGLKEYLENLFSELLIENNIETDANKREIKNYLQEVKSNLVSSNNYSEEYANTIIKFLEQKVDYDAEDFSITDTINKLNDIVANLTGKTNLQGSRLNSNTTHWDFIKIFSDENNYNSYAHNSGVQNEFFFYMLESSFDFSNEEDRAAILDKLFMRLNNEIGKNNELLHNWYNEHTNDFVIYMTEMSKLNKNGDSSWLDEFFSIVNEFSEQINATSGYKNATTVDSEALFGDKEELTPSDITTMLNDMLFSNDEGVVKLRTMLYDAFKRFNVDNYYDEAEIITDIIKMLNDKAGVENTKPIKLTKEAFEKLNEGTLFEVLEKYIKSDELREEYYFGIDDELDIYGEGRTSGACWAIAALTSLSSSPIGAQMIKDSMTFNDDDSVTVTFKGALDENGNPRSYTITREEMEAAKNNNDGVSYGDNTMFVLLLATEKLRKDLGILGIAEQSSLSPDDPGYGIYGGIASSMVELLTGKSVLSSYSITDYITRELYDNCSDEMKAYLDYIERFGGKTDVFGTDLSKLEILQELLDIKEQNYSKSELFYALKDGLISGDVILHLSTSRGVCTIPTYPDGDVITFATGNHAWGVKNITEEYITFWDLYKQEEYTVSIEDLLNSRFSFSYTVLNDEYELPNGWKREDYDMEALKEKLEEFEAELSNKQYDKTITDPDLYSYEIVDNDIEYYLRSLGSNNEKRKKILKSMESMLYYKIDDLMYAILDNMPNYTDYAALMNAYNEFDNNVLSSNVSDAMDLVTQLIDENMPLEYIIKKLQESLNAENIINQFLSLLPNGES